MNKNFTLDQLIMTGVDYKNCPVEVREKVSFTYNNLDEAYTKIKQTNSIREAAILSTCNRSEIYAVVNDPEIGKDYLKSFYSEFFNVDKQKIEEYIIFRSKEDVIKHLFEVACGFQSLVLGEDQILGQVKDSYNTALKNESTGKFLNRLFIDSITSSKKIKTMTGISENPVSVSSIGVKLIEQKLESLCNKKALIIGIGEMSRLAVQNLLEKQIGGIFVTNRTRRKVTDFSKEFPEITEIDFKNRYELVGDVDVIISCTSAPHYVINKEKFTQYYKNQPLCILDLAVPRDIDPDIQEIQGVELYRLDDLEKIVCESIEKRMHAKEKGEKILIHDVKKYVNWLEEAKLIDIIVSIQDSSKEILTKELKELNQKLDGIDEKQMQIIEKAFNNFAKSFIHQPMVKLKEFVKENPGYNDPDLLNIKEDT